MKSPDDRVSDALDRLTNENAELKERIRELEAELERKESSLNTYRRTYNEGWK